MMLYSVGANRGQILYVYFKGRCGGEEKSLVIDPGSELRLRREKEKGKCAKIIEEMSLNVTLPSDYVRHE